MTENQFPASHCHRISSSRLLPTFFFFVFFFLEPSCSTANAKLNHLWIKWQHAVFSLKKRLLPTLREESLVLRFCIRSPAIPHACLCDPFQDLSPPPRYTRETFVHINFLQFNIFFFVYPKKSDGRETFPLHVREPVFTLILII